MTKAVFDNINVLRTGFLAPEFTLLDTDGQVFSFRKSLVGSFLCLCFFPSTDNDRFHTFLQDLNRNLPQTASGLPVRVVGISPERVERLRKVRDRLQIGFPLLSDPDAVVSRRYYVVEADSPKPSAHFCIFVIDDEGIIRYRASEITGLSKYVPEELRSEVSRLI